MMMLINSKHSQSQINDGDVSVEKADAVMRLNYISAA